MKTKKENPELIKDPLATDPYTMGGYLRIKANAMGITPQMLDPKAIDLEKEKELKDYYNTLKEKSIFFKFIKNGFEPAFVEELFKMKPEKLWDINKNTVLSGDFGVGKTISILKSVELALRKLPYEKVAHFSFTYIPFLSIFHKRYEKDLKEYQNLKKTQLLIIDEFATIKTHEREDFNTVLHDILDARLLKKLPTLLITNIKESFLKSKLEPSLLSRFYLFKNEMMFGPDKRKSHER